MKRFGVTCAGIEPILINPVTTEMLLDIRNGTTRQKRRGADFPVEEEAREKLLWGDDYGYPGRIVLPIENLYAALKAAGRKVKKGKSQISTATTTTLFSFMKIEEKCMVFGASDGDEVKWEVDLRRGTNPNGGQLVVLVRPKITDWRFTVTARVDDDIDESLVRELFTKAGTIAGLGDFRPSTGGPFGMFEVASWTVLEDTSKKPAGASRSRRKAKTADNGAGKVSPKELAGAVK